MTELLTGVFEMDNATYHAHDSLSSTGMKLLLDSPEKFAHKTKNPEHKDAFDFGTAWHAIWLQDPNVDLHVVDAADWRGKDAREARELARVNKQTPILKKDYDQIMTMMEVIQRHPLASNLTRQPGDEIERSFFWVDPRTGVQLRVRADLLRLRTGSARSLIVDGKTTMTARPERFARSAMDYGYHIQAALYVRAIKELGLDDDPLFLLLVQEKEAPYSVVVGQFAPDDLKIGDFLVDKAIDLYKHCKDTNSWPGYCATEPIMFELPGWYRRDFEGVVTV